MTRSREELIRELSAQAAVPSGTRSMEARALGWLLTAVAVALLGTAAGGPLHTGPLARTVAVSTGAVALLLGAITAVTAAMSAFRSAVPSGTPVIRHVSWPLMWLCAWLLLLAVAAQDAAPLAVPHSKRAQCWLEVMTISVPCVLLGLLALRRLWPLHGAWTGAMIGLAAGAIVAITMDLACDRSAAHSLFFHVVPGISVALLGALVGAHFLQRP
jgi:hypothetical protein